VSRVESTAVQRNVIRVDKLLIMAPRCSCNVVYSYTLLIGSVIGCLAGIPGVNGYASERRLPDKRLGATVLIRSLPQCS